MIIVGTAPLYLIWAVVANIWKRRLLRGVATKYDTVHSTVVLPYTAGDVKVPYSALQSSHPPSLACRQYGLATRSPYVVGEL